MKRRIIWRIVLGLVLLLALFLCVTKVFIPLFDTSAYDKTFVPDIKRYTGAEGDFTLTSENLTFTLDPATTHFTLTDHRTGKVWSSSAPGVASDSSTMLNEKERLQSILTLDYKNNTGKQTTFSSFAKSVTNSLYEVSHEGDTIRVTFTIGDIARTYLFPEAMTDDRFQAILDKLDKKAKRTVQDAYKKYNPAKYGKKDDPAALEAAYPDLKEGKIVWVLRNKDMKANAAAKLEEAMISGGYTMADYEYDESRIVRAGEIEGATDKPIFNVTIAYRLEGDDLVVEVPLSEITYNPDYPPTALNVLPAFGAAGSNETGYILVPEGSGAIIRYNNGKTKQNPYYANMYGWDWAAIRKEVVSETRMSFPVFGMATGGSSFVCIMEEGASWGGINADIAGRAGAGSYNSANAVYAIIHGDSYDVSERTNNNVYMFEQQLPDAMLRQRYRFVASDSYMDMAAAYRDYLLASHPEMQRELSAEAHTVIELVGAIDKVQQRMGVPTNVPIPLTTYKQATELLNKLAAEKLPNLSIRYTGWTNGGLNQTILNKIRLMSELGSERELKAFAEAAKAAGVPLYLDGLTQFARDSGMLEGFLAMRDAAQHTTREEAEIPEYSAIWYGPIEDRDTYYLLKPALAMKNADVLSGAVTAYGAAGISFRDLGGMLSADYNAKDLVTREEVRLQQIAKIRELQEKGQSVMIRQGNDYAAVLADIVTDLDFDGLQYRILDEYVPFYTAALHGSVVYTGSAINLADDRETLLLRSAEMGASLQYTLMADDVEELQDSWFSEYYGADVSIIYDDMINVVKAYNQALSGTFNQKMTGHERIGDVTITTYENGIRVYVNYGYEEASVDGVTIPARSYTAKEAIE
ncbi:MAG: hypothetical protein IJZ74_04715 [Clostridia bacterium]|nr:hypothetical protein [Clostridia bacterium]